MRINSLIIEKLFEIFDYDISLSNEENLLIITGPNGFGKTMILNILFSLFNKQFMFFQKLVFHKITILLDDKTSIVISKKNENDKKYVKFIFFKDNKEIESFDYTDKLDTNLERYLQRYLPIERLDEARWLDHRTDTIMTMDELIGEYAGRLPKDVEKNLTKIKSQKINDILNSIKVHLIREQRLFRRVQNVERDFHDRKNQAVIIDTIQSYANELKQIITLNLQQSFKISQQLDSSYPDRLVKEKNKLTEDEYNIRFDKLKEKQEKLANNGLYESKQQFLGYSKDDSKALLVYLNDLEEKLGVFDRILEKLELFTGILNERRFTFKTIQIDREKGFYFRTSNGSELKLNQLSSGEQHEVVLLYELIFNAKPNTLVLIDEPEISLHITWQKEFINDLIKIIKIQNIQVLLATHSPSIINDRWDLVYNLEKSDAL